MVVSPRKALLGQDPSLSMTLTSASATSSGRIKVVVISGPTAVGKSALAESIAKSLDGGAELISADSVQVYRGMDIGSAKPTPEERAAVKYHLLDIADPTGLFHIRARHTALGHLHLRLFLSQLR